MTQALNRPVHPRWCVGENCHQGPNGTTGTWARHEATPTVWHPSSDAVTVTLSVIRDDEVDQDDTLSSSHLGVWMTVDAGTFGSADMYLTVESLDQFLFRAAAVSAQAHAARAEGGRQ